VLWRPRKGGGLEQHTIDVGRKRKIYLRSGGGVGGWIKGGENNIREGHQSKISSSGVRGLIGTESLNRGRDPTEPRIGGEKGPDIGLSREPSVIQGRGDAGQE